MVKQTGFGSMDTEKRREIASRGGKAAHAIGRAHKFTSEEAKAAYKKAKATGRLHRFTPEEAREAGRKGGLARSAKKQVAAKANAVARKNKVI